MRSTARGLLALLAGLMATAGLLSATSAPASAGQVGVTISIRGAGTVEVVEGTLEDGGSYSCVRTDNQDHRVTVSCPRIRNSEVFEAWVWLRATPAEVPAGEWKFEGWSDCDTTRWRDGRTECGVHSGSFSSDERYPSAKFQDTRGPAISVFEVRQELGVDRQFRVSYAVTGAVRTECRTYGLDDFTQCVSGSVRTLPEGEHRVQVRALDQSGNVAMTEQTVVSVDTEIIRGPEAYTRDNTADLQLHTGGGDGFSCSIDRGPYGPCGGGTGALITLDALPDGPHTFHAKASRGSWIDPVAAEWSWVIDTVAPTAAIHAEVDGSDAAFTFSSNELATFECRLDTPAGSGGWFRCTPPLFHGGLEEGEHVMSVRATDRAGNVSATDSHRWTVDTVAPTTTLEPTTSADRASFAFSAPGATSYECRLTTPAGAGTWTACSSTTSYAGLVPGEHRFEVRATDQAGNVEATPASHTWTATAPVVHTPGTSMSDTPTPTPAPATPSATRATSTTRATWQISAVRKGKVTIVVSSSARPTGAVVVRDRGRVIARVTLTAAHRGRVVVRLPRLRKGKHVLVAQYGGSATTAASTSARRTLTLR